ncbi:hypothetical protein F5X96DRAFT_671861 [Biscogniauxia mediterranea]|nr:hypothetical protein F5X96DRAFT_671861 [Biscogniauxia mediterranea]
MPVLPEGISLTTSARGGRGIAADRPFQPGDTIAIFNDDSDSSDNASSSTTIAISDSRQLGQTCSWCLSSSSSSSLGPSTTTTVLRACTGCRTAAYCSAGCQRADWRRGAHKAECEVFRRVRGEGRDGAGLPTPVRALVQVLLRPGLRAAVAGELEGHVDAFRRDRPAVWRDMEVQAMGALHYAGMETTPRTLAGAIEILCKLQVNSFNRLDADVGQTGLFLNPALAMVNHSCAPNAFVQFVGRKAVLHANQEIKKDEEIFISYIEPMPHRAHRQESLKRRYHFDCSCPRCEDDLDVYQLCMKYPHLELNSFSLVPDLDRLRNPPISRFLHSDETLKQVVRDIYPTCSQPLQDQTPEAAVKELRRRWRACEPLWKSEMYAVDPISQVLTEANIYFSEHGNLTYSVVISCFMALHCEPFRFPMPFAPLRVKGLFMIAKLLANITPTTMNQEAHGATGPVAAKISQVLSKVDQATMCQVLASLVVHYGPAAHSAEWQVYGQAKDMLSDIASLPGRELENYTVKAFLTNPKGVEEARFFESAILNPIRELSKLAPEVMVSEFGS